MGCDCKCHPNIAMNCWCPSCMDNHIDFGKIMEQMGWCEYCGDGIPKTQMKEHHEWCIPMTKGGNG